MVWQSGWREIIGGKRYFQTLPQVSRSDNSDPLFGKSHEVAAQFGAFLSLSRRIESLPLSLDEEMQRKI
jgi:hypothetical protein